MLKKIFASLSSKGLPVNIDQTNPGAKQSPRRTSDWLVPDSIQEVLKLTGQLSSYILQIRTPGQKLALAMVAQSHAGNHPLAAAQEMTHGQTEHLAGHFEDSLGQKPRQRLEEM